MSRIKTVTSQTANANQKNLLGAIQSQMGMVPNFLAVMAQSPDALSAFLGLHEITDKGALDPQTGERIALIIAEENACEYCVAAHSAIGRKAGLTSSEIESNRAGSSEDAKAAAAVEFAAKLNEHKGDLTQSEFEAIRAAGYSDAEIVEIITHVGMNILTNLIGKALKVDIDFPKIELLKAA